MMYAFVMLVSLLIAPALAQSNPHAAVASCIGSDAGSADPEAREAVCLRELRARASRKGNVLSLKLDDGKNKTYRSNPQACHDDLADKCVNYYLVGYHPSAGRYLVFVTGYEASECKLVSARDGRATTFLDIPHFAPDGSTFFVTGHDGTYDGWLGIGSVATNPPALVWEMGLTVLQHWEFLRWIDNDQIALRDSDGKNCLDGNCETVLKRTAGGWELQRLPSNPAVK